MWHILFSLVLILLAAVFFSQGYTSKVNSSSNKKKFLFVSGVILILLCSLRNVAVGPDTYQYSLYFEEIKKKEIGYFFENFIQYFLLDAEGKDPGFYLFVKLFQLLSSEYLVFLFFYSTLFYSSCLFFLYKNLNKLNHLLLGILILVSLFNFFAYSAFRQGMALSLLLFSFELVKNKIFFMFLALLFLISSFHKTALLFFPIYFLYNLKSSKSILIVGLVLVPIIFVFKQTLVEFMSIASSYDSYYKADYKKVGTPLLTLLICSVTLTYLNFKKKIEMNDVVSNKIFNCFVISIYVLPLTWVDPNMVRALSYFSIFAIILIPKIIKSIVVTNLKIKRGVFAGAIILFMVIIAISNNNFEYKFFWEEMKLGKNYE